MAAMNMKDAMKKARQLGCEIAQKRNGEYLITDPEDRSNPAVCSNHRKDAPRHLLVMLKRIEERQARARLLEKANAHAVQSPASPLVDVKKITRGASFTQVVTVTEAAPAVTLTPAAPSAPEPKEKEMADSKLEIIPKRYEIKWNPLLDAHILDWFSKRPWKRGESIRVYESVRALHPEWLIDQYGQPIKESTVAMHINVVLRNAHAPSTPTTPLLTQAHADEYQKMVGEYHDLKRDLGTATSALVERNAQLARHAQSVLLAEQGIAAIFALLKSSDAETLQTIIDLAKQ